MTPIIATEMLRLGVSLPALMLLLGHKDVRMTLRYVQVTHQGLQREFHLARQNAAPPHRLPIASIPNGHVQCHNRRVRMVAVTLAAYCASSPRPFGVTIRTGK